MPLSNVYDATLLLHVLAGLACVGAVIAPLVSRKGGRVHRRAGWVFLAALAGTALTGAVIAACWIGAPLAVKPIEGSPERLARAAASLRAMGWFFAFIAWLAAAAGWHAVSALRGRRSPSPWWLRVDRCVAAATFAGGGALLLYAWHLEHPLFAVFGALGVFGGVTDWRTLHKTDRASRMIRHLESMLGGFTVVITAFAVLVGRRYVGEAFQGAQMWFWVLPVAVGMTLSEVWKRRAMARYSRSDA